MRNTPHSLQTTWSRIIVVFCVLIFPLASCSPEEPLPARDAPVLNIPPRSRDALSGSAFLKRIAKLTGAAREAAVYREIIRGNVPIGSRTLKPVVIYGRDAKGKRRKVLVWVTGDYLAIGSDRDNVRVPMTPGTAQRLADRFKALLPTPNIVDAVYRSAAVKLAPRPMPFRGKSMVATPAYQRHDFAIDQQRGSHRTVLTAGHKKDIVLSLRLARRPYQVAIYGWHRPNGRPIQPISLVHHEHYVDYSHGVRLVSERAYIDGRPISLAALYRDRTLAALVSNEGPLRITRLHTPSLGPVKK